MVSGGTVISWPMGLGAKDRAGQGVKGQTTESYRRAHRAVKRKQDRERHKYVQQGEQHVKEYIRATTNYAALAQQAVVIAEAGLFSPEAARFVVGWHNSIRDIWELLERTLRIVNDPLAQRPRTFNQSELLCADVELQQIERAVLRCRECGATWTVERTNRRMPPRYWQCPNGCNKDAKP